MTIPISELESLVKKLLLQEYSEEETRLMTDIILFGEMSGRPSHGLLRLLPQNYGVFVSNTRKTPTYLRKTAVSTVIDGGGNPGMLIGSLALKEVIDIATKQGIGMVGTKGSIHTTGSLSYYCYHLAQAGLIGLVLTHCSPFVAPFNLKKAIFGTNPLALGIPGDPDPFIFDMATSATTFGAIAEYKIEKKPLPAHVAINSEGQETTDPEEALKGAILAFDHSYKGSGLAMMVEILAGVATGASFAGTQKQEGWGNLYLAFSPDLLSDLATLKSRMKDFLQVIETTPTRDGTPVRLPGTTTLKRYHQAKAAGNIEVQESTLAYIRSQLR